MNKDEVLSIARDVGAAQPESLYGRTDYVVMTQAELERFAAIVAAAERKACAKVAEETVCATHLPTGVKIYGYKAAVAIRERSNHAQG